MITSIGLSYQYQKDRVFNFPDLALAPADTLLILGKSGAGKTTLLHLLAMFLKPNKGNLIINNTEVTQLKNAKLAKFRAQNIGVVFQKPHFVSALSVEENLLLTNYLAEKPIDKGQLNQLAQTLGITNHLHKKISELSLGEQQRVAIARALMNKPALILADEPTSSLDDENCQAVIELLKNQAKSVGACLIIVTHDHRLKNVFNNQITLE